MTGNWAVTDLIRLKWYIWWQKIKKNCQFWSKFHYGNWFVSFFGLISAIGTVPLIAALFMKAAALRLFFLLLSFTVVKKYKYRFDTQLTLESHSNYQFGSKLTLSTPIWPRKSWWLLFHSFWRGNLEITNIFKSVSSSVWSLVFLKPLFRDKYSDCLREKWKNDLPFLSRKTALWAYV